MSSSYNPEWNPSLYFDQYREPLIYMTNFKISSKNIILSFALPALLGENEFLYGEPGLNKSTYMLKHMLQIPLSKVGLKIVSYTFKFIKLPALSVSDGKSHIASDFYLIHLLLDKKLSTRDRFFFKLLVPAPELGKTMYLLYNPMQFFSGSFSKLSQNLILGRLKYNSSPILVKKKNLGFRFCGLNLKLIYTYDMLLGDLTKEINQFLEKQLKNYCLEIPFFHTSTLKELENDYESIVCLKLKRRLDTRNEAFFNLMVNNNKDLLIVPKICRL